MANVARPLLGTLAVLFVVATALPLLRHEAWWIRIFDFPRLQLAGMGVALLLGYLAIGGWRQAGDVVVLVLVAAGLAYQVARIVPYTPVTPLQVLTADTTDGRPQLSLLVANVLMDNREAEAFVALVRRHAPDVVLTLETDAWWEQALCVLEETHPFTIKHPIDNTYGILLHSRLPLVDPEVRFLLEEDVPSVHTRLRLPNGALVRFFGLHPKPPYPKEAKDTTERDAELLLVGRAAKDLDEPTIVAGDLNDVAWSPTTRLFQDVSGLLDPRIGRGMYSTFHAGRPLLRWPLDHVFHSDHFKLVRLSRLPAWGSDHFPVLVVLALAPEGPHEQEEPEADTEEQRQAQDKIEAGRPRDTPAP